MRFTSIRMRQITCGRAKTSSKNSPADGLREPKCPRGNVRPVASKRCAWYEAVLSLLFGLLINLNL